MSQRFFVEMPIGDAVTAQLVEAEARHLVQVMRARPGDEVTLFDGSGYEYRALVSKSSKTTVALSIADRRLVDRELSKILTLAVALPKGDRQKVLVEKLVELGVTRLIPLESERGVAEATPAALKRLRRQVIEASKQCGRNRLMEIAHPQNLDKLMQTASPDALRVLADPSGQSFLPGESKGNVLAAVGPEGGFTEREVQLAVTAGWQIATLGPRILRIETAAMALAALFSQRL